MVHRTDTHHIDNTTPVRRLWQRGAYALAAATLVAVTACASSSDSSADKADGVASVDDVEGEESTDDTGDDSTETSTAGAGESSSGESQDPELILADWEECMKDQGIDTSVFVDADGGNDVGSGEAVTLPADFDPDAMEAAAEACDPIMEDFDPFAGMTPEEKALADDYLVVMENCLKEKGFDIPLTDPGGNGLGDDDEEPTGFSIPEDFDPEAMDQAFADCEEENPVPDELADFEG